MDLSRQALQTNEKVFSNFKFVFEILSENIKMFKRIARREYWSNCNVLNINGFVLTSSKNQLKVFFQISFRNNGRKFGRLYHDLQTNYASPTSGEAYRNRRLTTNFELWVEIFCVPTCFHMRIPKPCLSVRPSVRPSVRTPRKEITIASSISVLH